MIGLVVNPVAGVGGPAGLAGSDGADAQARAAEHGSEPRAGARAMQALAVVARAYPGERILTAAGAMGADAVAAAGLEPVVVFAPSEPATTSDDTAAGVAAAAAAGASLVLVAGGDGTLRDAVRGLAQTPGAGGPAVLGIPAGVKMYSPVFAVTPVAAGALAADWLGPDPVATAEREVLDVDEEALRHARVEPVLYGTLRVPLRTGRTQARKAPTPVTEQAAVASAARGAVAAMRPGVRYLLGPGGTTARIAAELGVAKTPLGVDVVLDGRLVAAGADERRLLAVVAAGPAKAVVTVIGGQGFLLGRGNQQLSARVIRALGPDPLLVVAPEQKLVDLGGRPLLIDTGDAEVDASLAGHIRVITGAAATAFYAVAAPETSLV
ncbi:Predicted polyphosphate-or ATP-dependent NAD kinase [Microbacterium azadirachtae]|uniref:Predicted polyphosphate-or ATP-dependent NAD kinase n=1 Tax=Microbacterium azadirachtae TaxID=582680 RepID=A0A1I6HCR3_9MICO|nr:NAD(+)/NADH kinase [Microbacterium azadirachtae]SFR52239.1 Predicted polyphosphate-or ATP-dependent NAD kinase [Microbacterium azadirachtae]